MARPMVAPAARTSRSGFWGEPVLEAGRRSFVRHSCTFRFSISGLRCFPKFYHNTPFPPQLFSAEVGEVAE